MENKTEIQKIANLSQTIIDSLIPQPQHKHKLVIPPKLEFPGEEFDVSTQFEEVQVQDLNPRDIIFLEEANPIGSYDMASKKPINEVALVLKNNKMKIHSGFKGFKYACKVDCRTLSNFELLSAHQTGTKKIKKFAAEITEYEFVMLDESKITIMDIPSGALTEIAFPKWDQLKQLIVDLDTKGQAFNVFVLKTYKHEEILSISINKKNQDLLE